MKCDRYILEQCKKLQVLPAQVVLITSEKGLNHLAIILKTFGSTGNFSWFNFDIGLAIAGVRAAKLDSPRGALSEIERP